MVVALNVGRTLTLSTEVLIQHVFGYCLKQDLRIISWSTDGAFADTVRP